MKIELHEITIRDVVDGYEDNLEEGVTGYGGRLNIRPKYQREFVYDFTKRNAVIETIRKGFPLNVMYWVRNGEGSFELMDGQQRTVSFCQYVAGEFSVDQRYFHNLTQTERDQILDYKLMVYFCEGSDIEKLDWFKTINIAGEKLTDQELRNAMYTGPWLTHAKSIFSKTNCPAYLLSKDYVNGLAIRQDILETALEWKSKGRIKDYMAEHQHDPNANELWMYFKGVIDWVKLTFPKHRKEMKGLDWGALFDEFSGRTFDTAALEGEITELMMDDDVTSKKGIYLYVLTRESRHLNLRAFTPAQKRAAYDRQKGKCKACKKVFELDGMEADHITPWTEGGKTEPSNCQMLCRECNRRKGAR